MSDLLLHLLAMNVLAAAAVVVVVALRLPVRRLFGPRIAYGLWWLAPLAALAMGLPRRTVVIAAPAAPAATDVAAPAAAALAPAPAPAGIDPWDLTAGLWIAGALASVAWLAWRQAQFARAARAGVAGPAVIGVLKPRIVTPQDFGERYTAREQQVVLAHEASHVAGHDSRINALVALARCVNWFNPLVHLAAHLLRIDQELACDARVVAAHPNARRSYAEAMLKTQLAARPLPLGCHWLASRHPLAERIAELARPAPGRARLRTGAALVALLGLAAVGSAWASKPAQVVVLERPRPSTPAAAVPQMRARPLLHRVSATDPPVRAAEDPPAPRSAPAEEPAAGETVEAPPPPAPTAAETAPEPVEAERAWRIYGGAGRSWVEPGYAVRLQATAVDPEGYRLTNDVTAFGSQRKYRLGSYHREESRHGLYTSVLQRGDRIVVMASLNSTFKAPAAGAVELGSGETGVIEMGNGQTVTVTPTLRAETPEEVQRGERTSLSRRTSSDADWRDEEAWRRFEAAREGWKRAIERCRERGPCQSGL